MWRVMAVTALADFKDVDKSRPGTPALHLGCATRRGARRRRGRRWLAPFRP
jgi:hypothetical protein